MRRESRAIREVETARIQGYHEGGYGYSNAEAYAFQGFKELRYFTSDRYEKLTDRFLRPNGQPCAGIGLEIETECTQISSPVVLAEVFDKIIFPKFPDGLFKMQRDGSLSGCSAECITQIMTKGFIRNNYRNFRAMFNDYFQAFGISASRSGNCGMHVNISNGLFGKTEETQTEAIKKLLYLVNHHFNFFCALFYRDIVRTSYCSRMRQFDDMKACKDADLRNQACSHGVCFNMGHFAAGRIELRLVGGQKDFACFRNTMESIFFLVKRVQKVAWRDLNDLGKVFCGCNQYVYDRIKSYCLERGTITREVVNAIGETVVREELI